MAKLRRNHNSASTGRRSRSRAGSSFSRGLFRLTFLLLGVLVLLFVVLPRVDFEALLSAAEGISTADYDAGRNRLYLPTGQSDQVVHHKYYSLGYDNDWEQPRWVAHTLSDWQVYDHSVPRSNNFRSDPLVRDYSAADNDYRGSGYTRGHLVPAGDMNFDEEAMSESFYFSNISPQRREHNAGIWRELEETTRDWATRYGKLYVVTGPIMGKRPRRIGRNRVAVPKAFYKVLLTEDGRGVGFIIPHKKQTAHLLSFAVPIDEVELATGLDFFPELPFLATDEVEANFNPNDWPEDSQRFEKRLNFWNNN